MGVLRWPCRRSVLLPEDFEHRQNTTTAIMGDEPGEDAEARKAAVKARMAAEAEEAAKNKKKKGFMTPARKSKLRMLLRKKAAEELKKEEERKREERRKVIEERCGAAKNIDGASDDGKRAIIEQYFNHIQNVESDKFDMEMRIMANDYAISELTRKVTDLRGKFVKPILKKVSKFEDKFAQLNKKASEFKFRTELRNTDLNHVTN